MKQFVLTCFFLVSLDTQIDIFGKPGKILLNPNQILLITQRGEYSILTLLSGKDVSTKTTPEEIYTKIKNEQLKQCK